MINLKIQDGVLQDAPDKVIILTNKNNKIIVESNTNSSTPLYLIISGFTKDYLIPLYFTSKKDDCNVFENYILFGNDQINYMKNNPNKLYTCSIKIENIIVPETFKISIITQDHIINLNSKQDIVVDLQNKYNELQAALKNFMSSYPSIDITEAELQKGAVPVATGYGNTYVWDYPNLIIKDLLEKMKKSSEILIDLSEQNKYLISKVSELETKLNNHLNEQYIL